MKEEAALEVLLGIHVFHVSRLGFDGTTHTPPGIWKVMPLSPEKQAPPSAFDRGERRRVFRIKLTI